MAGFKRFKCPRCGRVWVSDEHDESVECICHEDCPYRGGIQTVTTVVSKTELTVKFDNDPTELKPH